MNSQSRIGGYAKFLNEFRPRPRVFYSFSLATGRNNYTDSKRHFLRIIRVLLFAVTSSFYLVGPPLDAFRIKLIVVAAMLGATFMAQNLYDTWEPVGNNAADRHWRTEKERWFGFLRRHDGIFMLVLAETLGIAFLLLPTGGLDSPFVWYALNPIIAATVFIPGFYGWGILGIFLGAACMASNLYPGIHISFFSFLTGHWDQLLVLCLTTSIVQVTDSMYRRMAAAHQQVEEACSVSERYLEHITSLYQVLEAFSTREDREQLAEVFAGYTSRLCLRPAACLLKDLELSSLMRCDEILHVSESAELGRNIDWFKHVNDMWSQMGFNEEYLVRAIENDHGLIIARPIVCHGEFFGILAFWDENDQGQDHYDRRKALSFLADLGGITLERFKSDQLWGRLLVSEEQNRICNEVHDTIAQYLFSLTCAIHALSREEAHLQDKLIQEQLKLVGDTAQRASSELRESIYSLSPAKRGESIFVDNLASYLDDLGRLNSISVDLQVDGKEDLLSPALRKGLYRIAREACSNAVRHGGCTILEVNLIMSPRETVLGIKDNGTGYRGGGAAGCPQGLGITNMCQVAEGFGGEVRIQSEPGGGTLVLCTIPWRN